MDPLIELLENAFGAGYDHARETIWSWDRAFKDFLSAFAEEVEEVRNA